MNEKLYLMAEGLSEEQLKEDKGAFFGSIFQTLNHLMFGDRFLLTRIRDLLNETSILDEVDAQWEFEPGIQYHDHLKELKESRIELDRVLSEFVLSLNEETLQRSKTVDGVEIPVWVVLQHLFNHQTHHRGQITTLFSQFGVDIGLTDINMYYFEKMGTEI